MAGASHRTAPHQPQGMERLPQRARRVRTGAGTRLIRRSTRSRAGRAQHPGLAHPVEHSSGPRPQPETPTASICSSTCSRRRSCHPSRCCSRDRERGRLARPRRSPICSSRSSWPFSWTNRECGGALPDRLMRKREANLHLDWRLPHAGATSCWVHHPDQLFACLRHAHPAAAHFLAYTFTLFSVAACANLFGRSCLCCSTACG